MIIDELYDALVEAGASEVKAKDAARAVADFKDIVHRLEVRMGRIEALLGVNVLATVVGVVKLFLG